jgi:hypothetical protein
VKKENDIVEERAGNVSSNEKIGNQTAIGVLVL